MASAKTVGKTTAKPAAAAAKPAARKSPTKASTVTMPVAKTAAKPVAKTTPKPAARKSPTKTPAASKAVDPVEEVVPEEEIAPEKKHGFEFGAVYKPIGAILSGIGISLAFFALSSTATSRATFPFKASLFVFFVIVIGVVISQLEARYSIPEKERTAFKGTKIEDWVLKPTFLKGPIGAVVLFVVCWFFVTVLAPLGVLLWSALGHVWLIGFLVLCLPGFLGFLIGTRLPVITTQDGLTAPHEMHLWFFGVRKWRDGRETHTVTVPTPLLMTLVMVVLLVLSVVAAFGNLVLNFPRSL
jgi:hypothetical protein